jgi:hypothetical protein
LSASDLKGFPFVEKERTSHDSKKDTILKHRDADLEDFH